MGDFTQVNMGGKPTPPLSRSGEIGRDCPLLVLSPPELRQALQRLAAKANSLADTFRGR